jgi:Ca2+-binding EF-hand superfamily protein
MKKRKKKKKVSDRHQEEDLMKELLVNQQLEYLSRHTHFNLDEVRSLHEMFKAMTTKMPIPGEMDRILFREVFQRQFGMTNDIMLDQMYYFFDADHEGSISITEWIKNLSVLLRGNLDEQIKYCYTVYDLNGDGGIGRQEIENLLRGCLIKVPGIDEEMLENYKDLVDIVLKKLDGDKQGQVTFDSFRSAVYRDPLLLQALGECLPSAETVRTYMILFCEDYNDFTSNYSLEGFPSYAYERQVYNDLERDSESLLRLASTIASSASFAHKRHRRNLRSKSSRRSFATSLIHSVEKAETALKKLDRKSVIL